MNYNFAILKNETSKTSKDHVEWVKVCEKYKVKYKVIDITKKNWLKDILRTDFDCFLTRPTGSVNYFKQLYDERLYVINYILRKKIYPTYEETLIYENKRMLSYWLQASNIPHPRTWVFYHKDEAIQFLENCTFPVVAKTSIGAAGTGVSIIRDKKSLLNYIHKAFSKKGIVRQWGPNLRKGNFGTRIFKRLKNISNTYEHFRYRFNKCTVSPDRWFVIFQEYIKSDFEWRCVRINNSYFGHKKLRTLGEKFSGTSKVSWDLPSENLLYFVKHVCDKRNFLCQAVDIFENKNGDYLVNEMQCFFGSRNPHQMIMNGKPGRYILKGSKWVFEEGKFNNYNSYELRLNHVLKLLKNNQL